MEPLYGICFSMRLSTEYSADLWLTNLQGDKWSQKSGNAFPFFSVKEARTVLASLSDKVEKEIFDLLEVDFIPGYEG